MEHLGLRVEMTLGLPTGRRGRAVDRARHQPARGRARRISVYPYFPIGYMSWMNQSAEWRADLGGIVASSVTPYQKVADYFKQHLKDKTYFLCERAPDAWEASQAAFEGEGGLHNPAPLQAGALAGGDARYETPAAVRAVPLALAAGEARNLRFLFGPALDDAEIAALRARYLSAAGFAAPQRTTPTISTAAAAACASRRRTRSSTTSSTTGCRARCSITATSTA